MKKLWCAVCLAACLPAAFANDDLLGAQAAFRQALSAQNTGDSKIISLQSSLEAAQKRKADAEAEVGRLTAELEAAKQQKAANDEVLKQAGERLNRAWQAAKGSNL